MKYEVFQIVNCWNAAIIAEIIVRAYTQDVIFYWISS